MAQDFLKECMSDPALVQGQVPMDEFNRAYCVRCVQKDCSRAGLNGSLFARRAATWKTSLFDSPPRADDADPKYRDIRSKRFVQISNDVVELRKNGVNYEVQTREMPEMPAALRKPEPPIVEVVEPEEPRLQIPTFETFEQALQPPPPEPEPPQPAPALESSPVTQAPRAPNAPPQNTAFEQGTVLPGGSSEKTVEVGGSYVFGQDE